jgi:hypothetical protein
MVSKSITRFPWGKALLSWESALPANLVESKKEAAAAAVTRRAAEELGST